MFVARSKHFVDIGISDTAMAAAWYFDVFVAHAKFIHFDYPIVQCDFGIVGSYLLKGDVPTKPGHPRLPPNATYTHVRNLDTHQRRSRR